MTENLHRVLWWQSVKYWESNSFTRGHVNVSYAEALQGTLFLPQGTLCTHPCSYTRYFEFLTYQRVILSLKHVSNFSLSVSVPLMWRRSQEIQDVGRYHESTIIDDQASMLLFYTDQYMYNVFGYNFSRNHLPLRALLAHLCREY